MALSAAMRKHPYSHHTSPCQHPTASGLPCPHRAIHHHPKHGPICALHAHHSETSEDRTAAITLHLSRQEKAKAQVIANIRGMSLSDLARDMLFGYELPKPLPPRIEIQVYGQLAKIGTNLNQATHALHRIRTIGDIQVTPDVLADLTHQLDELRNVIRKLQVDLVTGGGDS